MRWSLSLLALPLVSATLPNPLPPNDRVLYSAIETLTLVSGEWTTARRLAPVPQTSCASSSEWCKLADLSVLRCHKDGHSYDPDSVQWLCEARLPKEFDLGLVTIGCEGYDTADDAYVLRGSCAASYKLVLTAAGKKRYGNIGGGGGGSVENTFPGIILGIFIIAFIVVTFTWAMCWGQREDTNNGQPPPYSAEDTQVNGSTSRGRQNGGSNWNSGSHHHHHHHHNRSPARRSPDRESRPLLDSHTSKGYGVTSNR